MELPIHNNEHDFIWENTINVLSYEGYHMLEDVANAQNFLNEHSAAIMEARWKRIGKIVWQNLNESLKHPTFIYPIKHTH